MKIAVSGKFSDDVFDDAFRLLALFERDIQPINEQDIGKSLELLVYFPVILNNDLGVKNKSHRSYSSKENAEFVNIEIDYEEWLSSNQQNKISLLFSGLVKAINETKESRLHSRDKDLLLSEIDIIRNRSMRSAKAGE